MKTASQQTINMDIKRYMSEVGQRARAAARAMDARRVWTKRKPLVSAALKRLPLEAWQGLLQRAARADRILKGRGAGDIWQELQCLALSMCGLKLGTCRSRLTTGGEV